MAKSKNKSTSKAQDAANAAMSKSIGMEGNKDVNSALEKARKKQVQAGFWRPRQIDDYLSGILASVPKWQTRKIRKKDSTMLDFTVDTGNGLVKWSASEWLGKEIEKEYPLNTIKKGDPVAIVYKGEAENTKGGNKPKLYAVVIGK